MIDHDELIISQLAEGRVFFVMIASTCSVGYKSETRAFIGLNLILSINKCWTEHVPLC